MGTANRMVKLSMVLGKNKKEKKQRSRKKKEEKIKEK